MCRFGNAHVLRSWIQQYGRCTTYVCQIFDINATNVFARSLRTSKFIFKRKSPPKNITLHFESRIIISLFDIQNTQRIKINQNIKRLKRPIALNAHCTYTIINLKSFAFDRSFITSRSFNCRNELPLNDFISLRINSIYQLTLDDAKFYFQFDIVWMLLLLLASTKKFRSTHGINHFVTASIAHKICNCVVLKICDGQRLFDIWCGKIDRSTTKIVEFFRFFCFVSNNFGVSNTVTFER